MMRALTNRVVIWSHRYQLRRAEKWQKYHDQAAKILPAWHTPGRRKFLITSYYLCLVLLLFCAILHVWWPEALSGWMAFTIVMLIIWGVLRVSICFRDSAPKDLLDEYEYSVIITWQSISFRVRSGIMAFIIFSITMTPHIPAKYQAEWAYTLELLSALILILFVTLPTMVYALTFPHNPEDDD